MGNSIEVSLGNSRTIFRKSSIVELDTVGAWKFIDNFIDKNPKLSKGSSSSFIYFLDSSENLEGRDSTCLVAKEVIGFCDAEFLADFELSSMDLNSSKIVSHEYSGDMKIDSIFAAEKALRKTENYLPMWRVRVSGSLEQLIHLEFWKS